MYTINIQNPETRQIEEYLVDYSHLGQGLQGSVSIATNTVTGKRYALKTIRKENNSEITRLLKNELKALKKQKMLHGFTISSRFGTEYYNILLEFVPGSTIIQHNRLNNPSTEESEQILLSAFCELKKFHALNMVHFDSHTSNFMCKDGKSTLIDYGTAKESSSILAKYIDYMALIITLDEIDTINFPANLHCSIMYFYVRSYMQYISENKTNAALNVIIYGAVTIAAIYGISYYAAARIITTEIAKSLFMNELNKSMQDSLHIIRIQILFKRFPQHANLRINIATTLISAATLYNESDNFKMAADLLYTLTTGDLTKLKALDITQITKLVLLCYPISSTKAHLENEYDYHIRSEHSQDNICQNIVYPESWLSGFGLFKKRNAEGPNIRRNFDQRNPTGSQSFHHRNLWA